MTPLVIVKVGESIPALIPELGDYEDWIRAGLGALERPLVVIDPRRGETLPEPDALSAAIVTGSHAMVTEREAWSERTGHWLARLIDQAIPVLGICYGHQLLAQACGGEVGYHPRGIEIGTTIIGTSAAATDDALFSAMPAFFPAQTVHRQTVLRLPRGAVALAANDFEPHHAFRIGGNAWGVQFHPEFSADAMRGYIEHLDASLRREARDPGSLIKAVTATPEAASLLRIFARITGGAERFDTKASRRPPNSGDAAPPV